MTTYPALRRCPSGKTTIITASGLSEFLIETAKEQIDSELKLNPKRLLNMVLQDLVEVEIDCPFVGEIELVVERLRVYWECPVCRVEHDEEEGVM